MKTARALWKKRWWQGLMGMLLATGLVACSSNRQAQDESASSGAIMNQTPMSAPAPAPAPVSAPAPAPVARSMAPRESKAASTLGTQWGEGRDSRVTSVSAERITPEQPQDLGQMRYSDESSIQRALGARADSQLSMLLAGGNVEWSVNDGQGRPLRIYNSSQQGYQLAGSNGQRYELRFINRSNRAYEIVATVDGLDVISGQPGSLRNGGYLLRPGATLNIDGFRKSSNEVAAFRFATKDRAYAANTPAGDSRNVGVIGAALFETRLDEPAPRGQTGAPRPQGGPNAFPADPASGYAQPPVYRR